MTEVLTQTISEKINLIVFPKINLRKIWIAGFILITLLLILYIFQISQITKASFFVSEQERVIVMLSQSNKGMETGLFQENSLANLEVLIEKFNYEKVSKINYIQVLDNGMAVRH